MTLLWLPQEVQDEYDPAASAAAGLASGRLHEFVRRLKAHDSRLDLIWIKKGATAWPRDERWAIVRYNDSGIAAAWMVENADGGYAEPGDEHFQALLARDTAARDSVIADHNKAVADEAAAKEKARQETRREFRESLLDRVNHNHDARVSVPRDIA